MIHTLWQFLDEWKKCVSSPYASPLCSIDTESVYAMDARYLKAAVQLERDLPPNSVVERLWQYIDDFGKLIPAIGALRNPDLKTHHWMKVRERLTGSSDPWPGGMTLGWVVEKGVMEKKEELTQISENVSNEAVLTEMLHKIMDSWTVFEVKTKPFRNENFLLIEVDELLREIDDTQIQLETIRGSRHAEPIREQVDFWSSRISTFSDVLELWLQFQQKWLALEPVFQGDELLKDWTKKFQECDRFWREYMRKVHEFPGALRSTSRPKKQNEQTTPFAFHTRVHPSAV